MIQLNDDKKIKTENRKRLLSNIKLFESKKVRTHWNEKEQQWYFSVIDAIEILTDSPNPRDYWFKMKTRIKTEDGLELSTICRQLKLKAIDGKMRETDGFATQALLQIIQSIPSPKAEPFVFMNACSI